MTSAQIRPFRIEIASGHVLPGVGGHYAAHTHPGVLAADIRAFFTNLPKRTRP